MSARDREAALLDLIGELYRAAGDPARWPRVLARFPTVIDCAGVTLYTVDRRDQSVPFMVNHELPEVMEREYKEHYLAIDPRPRCALAHPNQPIYDYLHSTEAEIDRSEYYDWHRRCAGFRYYIGALLTGSDDFATYTGIGLQRTPRQGHVDEHEIALFDRLLPHLSQAVALSTKVAERGGPRSPDSSAAGISLAQVAVTPPIRSRRGGPHGPRPGSCHRGPSAAGRCCRS